MSRDSRQKRDLHAFNEEGMVLCNPQDKEAAHRAQMEGIATDGVRPQHFQTIELRRPDLNRRRTAYETVLESRLQSTPQISTPGRTRTYTRLGNNQPHHRCATGQTSVPAAGVEPAAFAFSARRSYRLSYTGIG